MEKTTAPSAHEVPQRVLDRIFDKYDVRGEDECWPWKLSVGSHGYGQVGWKDGDKTVGTTAHRVAYIAAIGPIPEGITIDHKCRNLRCGNPRHLRLRTNVANATDNGQISKTHCPQGHAYDAHNTYIDPRGHRRCRECRKRWLR